ncbi:MAG: DNA repair protein RecN, partial [Rhodobacterales bacterium]|nr:DNA repair protein RecN [Rhodobacterales bacterium]
CDLSAARAAAEEAAERLAAARRDEAFLRHAVEELADLAPEAGEEERLAEQRTLAMHAEQVIESLNAALADLSGDGGAEERLQSALRHLDRARAKAGGHLDGALATLDRAAEALAEGVQDVERLGAALDLDPAQQERVEERLFTLRALARKHDVAPDDLPALAQDLTARLAALDDGGADLARLETAAATAREAFVQAAADLSAARVRAARRLEKAMAKELEPLRLGKAAFHVTLSLLDEDRWTVLGRDGVVFEVSTNPGAAPGPLNRIASGGELSRFMLALKAVLAAADPVPTLVFDEVDSGIGGAVAAAVGTRLDGLARDVQVLVVTHSPQVAARGGHHWRVAKAEAGGTVETTVIPLDPAQRREEIARMLAGAEVTDAARAAADSLLEGPAE